MSTVPIRLTLESELQSLPDYPDVDSLFAQEVCYGRCLLLAGEDARAHAYPNLMGRSGGSFTPNWWEPDPTIIASSLYLFKLRDAYFFPSLGVIINGSGAVMKSSFGEAQFVTGDVSRLPHAMQADGEVLFQPPEGTRILGPSIATMPWGGISNYGHFLLDCMPPVAVCRQIVRVADHDFVFPPLQPWHKRHLSLVGMDQPRILPEEVYFAKELVWTSCMDHFLHAPNRAVLYLRETQFWNCGAFKVLGAPTECLWLSRRGDSKRFFACEAELERRLEILGFRIFRPEEVSIDEQIKVFAAARLVCGFTGAAFSNVLYCHVGTAVVEIQPSLMPGIWVRNLAAQVGCTWHPYFCASEPAATPVIVGGEVRPDIGINIKMDVNDFVAFIGSINRGWANN